MPAGLKIPNELGIYDMSGNIWEWTIDLVAPGATNRQLRGGSFAMQANHCRVVSAGNWPPDARYNDGGFRLVRKAID
jgi:formylglycine-generating enzyme required for sulfatase activity